MTLREFQMHRPRLANQLVVFMTREVDPVHWSAVDVLPLYGNNLRFMAQFPDLPPIVCVGPDHELFLETDDGPGCVGSWWWAECLPPSVRKEIP